MINTPAGHSSLVDADGVATWTVSGREFFFDCAHESVRVNDFGFAQIEERLDVALRYNFGVSRCSGEIVESSVESLVRINYRIQVFVVSRAK
jgi:hypothetical protein